MHALVGGQSDPDLPEVVQVYLAGTTLSLPASVWE